MPKSVTKIKKDGVEYISNVDRVNYTIQELTRAALRDIAKLVRKRAKQGAPKDSGEYAKNIATWVRKNKKTGEVGLHLGVYNAKTSRKKKRQPIYFAHIIEFGSRFVKGYKVLTNAVYENIDDIRRITGKYLSVIEDEQKAIDLIKEEDEVSDEG